MSNKKSNPRRDAKRFLAAMKRAGLNEDGEPRELRICTICHGLIPEDDEGRRVHGGLACTHHFR